MLRCNNDLMTNPSLVAPRWVFYLSVRYNNKLFKNIFTFRTAKSRHQGICNCLINSYHPRYYNFKKEKPTIYEISFYMLRCNNDLVIWFHCLVAQTNPSLVAPRWVFYLSVRYNNKLLKIYLRLEQLNQGIWKRLDSVKDPYLRKNADTLQILINNAFANSTTKKYQIAWKKWIEWTQNYPEVNFCPADPLYVLKIVSN